MTAYHEAGHALATLLLEPESRLSRVSIVPSTRGAAGYSMAVPPERMMMTAAQGAGTPRGDAGGTRGGGDGVWRRCRHRGAANDLAMATELAARMCLEWGMDAQAGLAVRRVLSSFGACDGGALVQEKIKTVYAATCALLVQKRQALCALASALLQREWLDGEEAKRVAFCGIETVQQ